MWGRKWYYDYLHLMWRAGIHPIDMVVRIATAFEVDTGEMGKLHKRFKKDHDLENFSSFDELANYWGQTDNMDRLREGEYGKLNYMYTYEILLENYDSFTDFLHYVSKDIFGTLDLEDPETFIDQCKDILDFSRELRITLTQELDSVVENKKRSFNFDLVAWRENGYKGTPAKTSTSDRFDFEFEFYLPNQQRDVLQRQLSQFRSHNINLTLRKMSEEINANEFFYRVRPATIQQ